MKIEFRKPAATGGGYVTLADEADVSSGSTQDRITAYQPGYSSSPSITPLFLSGQVNVQDLGNGQWSLSFGVARQHANAGAALQFLAAHGTVFDSEDALMNGLLGNMDLRISVDGQFVYMAAAALTGFKPDPHSDRSTFCVYSFAGSTYRTTAP